MIVYDIALKVYEAAVGLASPFNKKARLWREGRKDIFARLEKTFENAGEVAWFHCASLGEFEQGRPVIEKFRKRYPAVKILVTFFSPSGYEIRKNYAGADFVFYLPVDTRSNARRFISIVKPRIAVFIKYEFWLNYLTELKKTGVKTYVVSAIFRPSQLFFRPYGGFYRNVLHLFSHIFVQDENSEKLLAGIGVRNVSVCGDTRFDRVAQIAGAARSIGTVERFAAGYRVFITGSSWEKDDEITLKLIDLHRDVRFIIAPHEITADKIRNLCRAVDLTGRKAVCYTAVAPDAKVEDADVLIIDTFGILSSVYQYGYCAYIGGGFGVGIHNTLEAATFGLPLIFGPNYERFNEAVQLVRRRGAASVHDFIEADGWLRLMLEDNDEYIRRSRVCKQYVEENTGASDRIIAYGLI